MSAFAQSVVAPVRAFLDRPVRVPFESEAGAWTVSTKANGEVEVMLTVSADRLAMNMQTDDAASPFFLLSFAYWLERAIPGTRTTCKIVVTPSSSIQNTSQAQHLRRSMFLLAELTRLLPERVSLVIPEGLAWAWPASPIFNAEGEERNHESGVGGEAELERFLCRDGQALESFRELEPVAGFRSQMPVGLFDQNVTRATTWTPSKKSAVDMWAPSPDGRVLHLFELKDAGNAPLGILSEAVYYGLLLGYVRSTGGNSSIQVLPKAVGLTAARNATRIVMWLVAPSFHPLVFEKQDSPLSWLNTAAQEWGVEFRILPIAWAPPASLTWHTSKRWPAIA